MLGIVNDAEPHAAREFLARVRIAEQLKVHLEVVVAVVVNVMVDVVNA